MPTTPAIIIIGADALLAVRPATPGQLTNACYAAGYSAVIPASWGDELVAAGCLNQIAARGQDSVVLCSCPRVAERLRRVGNLAPHLLPMASPPVLAARYLRARAGATGVHITYVGDCPGASDPAIDRHATPSALFRSLAKRGIVPSEQPSDVDERLTRDARRFYSLPGGAPAPNWLYAEKRGYTLIEPTARDFLAEVAFRISEKERRVIDLAPRLGCACSGAVVGEPWTGARDNVAAMEPPRAVHEVLDHDVPLEMSAPIEPWSGSAADGEPTLALPLAELAAMHNPQSKAPAVRHSPPPPLTRGPRPAVRGPGEPVTGAGLAPASPAAGTSGAVPGAVPGAAPGAGQGAPAAPPRTPSVTPLATPPITLGRPRPPEPRTSPRAEPATSPRARSVTPPLVPVLPPVPPMPANLAPKGAGTAGIPWSAFRAPTPVKSATPISTPAVPIAPRPTPAVAHPAVAPVVAAANQIAPPVAAASAPSGAPSAAAPVAPSVPPAVAAAAAGLGAPVSRQTPVLSQPAITPPAGSPVAELERSRFAPPAEPRVQAAEPPQVPPQAPPQVQQRMPIASHFDLPSEAEAAAAALPKPEVHPAVAAAEMRAVAAAIAVAEPGTGQDNTSMVGALYIEPRNSTAMLEGPTLPHRPRRNRKRLWVMVLACIALVVAGAGVMMFRIISRPSAPSYPAQPAPSMTPGPSAPDVGTPNAGTPNMGTPAAPSTDTMGGGRPATTTVTDTVALVGSALTRRLPVGPAPVPATYTGRGARGTRGGDASAQTRLPSDPATVYAPGAVSPISTSQPAPAAKPVVPAKAVPKTAAELRASAAFRGALTPQAAAEMAAIRSEVSTRRHRDDSIKRADSAGTH